MRPIVWSERGANGTALSVNIQTHFASVQRPMLTENQPQILLPLQAQQLGRSYNGRLLVNLDITVREVTGAAVPPQLHHTDVRDLCVGEIPVLVTRCAPGARLSAGSVLCHQPLVARSPTAGNVAYFVALATLSPRSVENMGSKRKPKAKKQKPRRKRDQPGRIRNFGADIYRWDPRLCSDPECGENRQRAECPGGCAACRIARTPRLSYHRRDS